MRFLTKTMPRNIWTRVQSTRTQCALLCLPGSIMAPRLMCPSLSAINAELRWPSTVMPRTRRDTWTGRSSAHCTARLRAS